MTRRVNPSGEDKSSIFTDSTALKSEVEYPSAFGGFEMSPYSSVGELAQEGGGSV